MRAKRAEKNWSFCTQNCRIICAYSRQSALGLFAEFRGACAPAYDVRDIWISVSCANVYSHFNQCTGLYLLLSVQFRLLFASSVFVYRKFAVDVCNNRLIYR